MDVKTQSEKVAKLETQETALAIKSILILLNRVQNNVTPLITSEEALRGIREILDRAARIRDDRLFLGQAGDLSFKRSKK